MTKRCSELVLRTAVCNVQLVVQYLMLTLTFRYVLVALLAVCDVKLQNHLEDLLCLEVSLRAVIKQRHLLLFSNDWVFFFFVYGTSYPQFYFFWLPVLVITQGLPMSSYLVQQDISLERPFSQNFSYRILLK